MLADNARRAHTGNGIVFSQRVRRFVGDIGLEVRDGIPLSLHNRELLLVDSQPDNGVTNKSAHQNVDAFGLPIVILAILTRTG